jgi:carbon storage regulator
MLVLSRKVGEKLVIGDNITVTVTRMAGNRVTLGIDAPAAVRIVRGEIQPVADAFADGNEGRPAVGAAAAYGAETEVSVASVPRLAK